MDDLIRDFVVETLESLDHLDAELLRFEQEPHDLRLVGQIYRLLHTIKGTCGFLSLSRLERIAHAAEELISRFREGVPAQPGEVTLTLGALDRIKGIVHAIADKGREPEGDDNALIAELERAARGAGETSAMPMPATSVTGPQGAETPAAEPHVMRQNIRVAVDRLDHLMTMVSELVLVRNQLLELSRREDAGGFKLPLQRLSHITAELQDGVMRARMQSIGAAWSRLARTVRDLSGELGKEIRLETQGADTEIDRQILDVVKDCMVHLIRNAADHGIETAPERLAAGKAAHGTIRLRAGQEGSHIVLEVSDDGRGLDLERIRMRAFAQGIADDETLTRMGEGDVARLIFAPGFSTAGSITNLSGRGVGLDAVRTSIESVGGTVDVQNRPGRGTSVILRMPLTLAVAPVLIVEAAGQLYALPQVVISELVRPQAGGEGSLDRLGDLAVLRLRDRLIPVVDLKATLGAAPADDEPAGLVVICEVGHKRFGLRVDGVHQTEDVVVKPLSVWLRHIPYFSGTTILGDGSVILILEPLGFSAGIVAAHDTGAAKDEVSEAPSEAATPLLVFRAGDSRRRVVPLALVSRLEEFDATRIEMLGSKPVIQYKGGLLPLTVADPAMALRRDGLQPVLKLRHNGRRIGVAVDEIVDIIVAPLRPELSDGMSGYLGNVIVDGETMPVLDVTAFFLEGGNGAASDDGPAAVLLYEPSSFFQALLLPVIRGAGLEPVVAPTLDAFAALSGEARFVLGIVDCDGADARARIAAILADGGPEMIGLATRPGPALRLAAEQAGLQALVGKFDRRALLAALRPQAMVAEVAA